MRADLAGELAPTDGGLLYDTYYWWYCGWSDVFTDGYSKPMGVCTAAMPHRTFDHIWWREGPSRCKWMLRTVEWEDVANELAVDAHLEAQYDEAQGEGS